MSDTSATVPTVKCRVPGCTADATFDAFLADDIPYSGKFLEPDIHCPHICEDHAIENEAEAVGIRAYGSSIRYPYTKRFTTGFTRYRRRDTGDFLKMKGGFDYPDLRRKARKRRKT